MKVLVVSDTHGMDENLELVMQREMPFDILVHCGDVEGRDEYLQAELECPGYFVAGNCDYDSDLPSEEVFSLGDHRVLVTHGHYYNVSRDLGRLMDAARSRDCDVVLFGHIHVPVEEELDGMLIINPGSLNFPRQQNGRPSYAVLQLKKDRSIASEIRYL